MTKVQTPSGTLKKYLMEIVLPYDGDECLLWPYGRDRHGYGNMKWDGRQRTVSRLVCEIVNGPPPHLKYEAAHSCGKGHLGCVNPHHLEWKTRSANLMDRVRHGTHNRGEAHPLAKLSDQAVREMRALRGQMPEAELAAKFGVSIGTAYYAITGRTWGHVS